MTPDLSVLAKVYSKLAARHRLAATLSDDLNGPNRGHALLRLATIHCNLMADSLTVVLSLRDPLKAYEVADDKRLRMPERDMLKRLVSGLGVTADEVDQIVLVEARRQRAEFIDARKASADG